MAVERGKFIKNQLDSLPPDHPYRGYLEGLAVTVNTKNYIDRVGGGVTLFELVAQAVKEYKSQPHTPELVTMFHQLIWHFRGEPSQSYKVSPCPYTQEELTALEQQGKRVGYLPAELATQQSRYLLGKMFPNTRTRSVEEGLVTNDKNPSGWFDYETAVDAPYLNTTEEQLIERVAKDGRELLNLNQYIVAGSDSSLLTRGFLDEITTYVRLGSRDEGHVVVAGFKNCFLFAWWRPGDFHSRYLGGRSSGVKKA